MANKLSERQKKAIAICLIVALVAVAVSLIVWGLVSDDENTCVGFDCSGSPNSLNANPAGITCQADPCLATECCTVVPTVAPGTCVDFDCSGSPNSLNANPAGITCQADPCLATECCTSSTGGDDCTTPDPEPTEYNLSNVTGSLSKAGFSITGVECATGTGTPIATACSVAGQPYTLSGCSTDDSTNSPCSLSTLTQPTNGSWGGTICTSNSGEIQHGASCDLGCNTGYTPSNQPTCNDGVLSSTTLTCTPQLNPPFYLGGFGEKCSYVCSALGKTCRNEEIIQDTFFNDGEPGNDFFSRSCASSSISINSSNYNSMGPLYATAGNNNQCKYQDGSPSLCNTDFNTLSTSRRICKCVDP